MGNKYTENAKKAFILENIARNQRLVKNQIGHNADRLKYHEYLFGSDLHSTDSISFQKIFSELEKTGSSIYDFLNIRYLTSFIPSGVPYDQGKILPSNSECVIDGVLIARGQGRDMNILNVPVDGIEALVRIMIKNGANEFSLADFCRVYESIEKSSLRNIRDPSELLETLLNVNLVRRIDTHKESYSLRRDQIGFYGISVQITADNPKKGLGKFMRWEEDIYCSMHDEELSLHDLIREKLKKSKRDIGFYKNIVRSKPIATYTLPDSGIQYELLEKKAFYNGIIVRPESTADEPFNQIPLLPETLYVLSEVKKKSEINDNLIVKAIEYYNKYSEGVRRPNKEQIKEQSEKMLEMKTSYDKLRVIGVNRLATGYLPAGINL
ncbi:MAG: hypothetical protein KKF44_00605 [Nanoarchaeota archaeon]|nr:hypothetical protein [Nanoarchaeota archaeon]